MYLYNIDGESRAFNLHLAQQLRVVQDVDEKDWAIEIVYPETKWETGVYTVGLYATQQEAKDDLHWMLGGYATTRRLT